MIIEGVRTSKTALGKPKKHFVLFICASFIAGNFATHKFFQWKGVVGKRNPESDKRIAEIFKKKSERTD